MLDRGCGDRRPVGASGYRERDSVGLASWIKGLTISAASGVVCARKSNCHFTPVSRRTTNSDRVTVSMRLYCLPSHPPFMGCFSYGGSLWWPAGAGSGSGMQMVLRQQPGRLVRALIGC